MPQTSARLRAMFTDDGEAAGVLRRGGFRLSRRRSGFWVLHRTPNHYEWDALQYLVEEWDYAIEDMRYFGEDSEGSEGERLEPGEFLALSVE